MTSATRGDAGELTGSAERALLVLEALAADTEPVRLSDLARNIGYSKATMHRLLSTLVARGFATRAGRSYAVGTRLFELAQRTGTSDPNQLMGRLMPFLVELYERTNGAVSIGVLNQDRVTYSESVHNYGLTGIARRSHDRVPAYRTAAGKLLLAYQPGLLLRLGDRTVVGMTSTGGTEPETLQQELVIARHRRVAYLQEDRAGGRVEVAAPLFGDDDRPVAAIDVAGRRDRLDLARATAEVRRIASAASQYLRTCEPPTSGPRTGAGRCTSGHASCRCTSGQAS
jgi:IclR family transcriptional regulator, KDG regulon repressor